MRVRLVVWAVSDAAVDLAVSAAGERPSRRSWVFDVERVAGALCPIDVTDPASIAAAVGDKWVYAAYAAEAEAQR